MWPQQAQAALSLDSTVPHKRASSHWQGQRKRADRLLHSRNFRVRSSCSACGVVWWLLENVSRWNDSSNVRGRKEFNELKTESGA